MNSLLTYLILGVDDDDALDMFAADIDSKKEEKSGESNSKNAAEKKGKFNYYLKCLILLVDNMGKHVTISKIILNE